MNNKPWLFVDVSYLAHRARMALEGLSNEDVPTGVMYGFFSQLHSICSNPILKSSRVALFMDSKRSFRKEIYPEYKQHRIDNQTEEEKEQKQIMYEQLRLLRTEILPEMGFRIYIQEGFESDDLMAYAAENLPKKQKAVMITADGDLYQCMKKNVHWYDPARKLYYTPNSFWDAKGIPCWSWGKVKALSGCHSDNVKGIPGVGEKTAIDYLTGMADISKKRIQKIFSKEGKDIYERNSALVILPHEKVMPFVLREPQYNEDTMMYYFKKLGMNSFLTSKGRRRWQRFADNKMDSEEQTKLFTRERER